MIHLRLMTVVCLVMFTSSCSDAIVRSGRGESSSMGEQGREGPPGMRGSRWTFSNAMPSQFEGAANDFHLNTSTYNVYEKTLTQGWVLVGNLQGPQGSSGPQGVQGPQGVPGPAGSIGPVGPRGIAGLDGAPGIPGSPGAAGIQGIQGPPGVDGSDGTHWYHGDNPSTVPSASLHNGDYFLRTDGQVFQFNSLANSWIDQNMNLRGSDGGAPGSSPYNAVAFPLRFTTANLLTVGSTLAAKDSLCQTISPDYQTATPNDVALYANRTSLEPFLTTENSLAFRNYTVQTFELPVPGFPTVAQAPVACVHKHSRALYTRSKIRWDSTLAQKAAACGSDRVVADANGARILESGTNPYERHGILTTVDSVIYAYWASLDANNDFTVGLVDANDIYTNSSHNEYQVRFGDFYPVLCFVR